MIDHGQVCHAYAVLLHSLLLSYAPSNDVALLSPPLVVPLCASCSLLSSSSPRHVHLVPFAVSARDHGYQRRRATRQVSHSSLVHPSLIHALCTPSLTTLHPALPACRYAPFLLPFSRVLKRRLAALHSPSSPTAPSSLFVCTPSDQQSWVGKAVSRFTQVRSHTNWKPVHLPPSPTPFPSPHPSLSPSSSPQSPPSQPSPFCTSPSVDIELWSTVDGTPSTTANVGLHTLSPFPVDLVLSGPNLGRNTGRSFALSSGTIGAALEAAFAQRRAIALSFAFFDKLASYTPQHIDDACEVAVDVVMGLWQHWEEGVEVFNVNVPLGCRRDVAIVHTHVLHDSYGAIYIPSSYRTLHPTSQPPLSSSPPPTDPAANEVVASPLPLPSSPSPPPPRPTLPNGFVASPAPTSPVVIAGTEVVPLVHALDFRFNAEMFNEDWSRLDGYVGSDYQTVKSGRVSVTPLRATMEEARWRAPPAWAKTSEAKGERKSAL